MQDSVWLCAHQCGMAGWLHVLYNAYTRAATLGVWQMLLVHACSMAFRLRACRSCSVCAKVSEPVTELQGNQSQHPSTSAEASINECTDYIYPAARADKMRLMHHQERHLGHQAPQNNP